MRSVERLRKRAHDGLERRAAPGGNLHLPIVADLEDAELLGCEQVLAAVEDLVEHRRGVGDRAADHLQHLGRRCLLLQRLFGLVEQANVLDGDHGLIGEGLHQADLRSENAPHLVAQQRDHADGTPLPQHRHGQHVRNRSALHLPRRRGIPFRSAGRVLDMYRAAIEKGAPPIRESAQRQPLPSNPDCRVGVVRSWSSRADVALGPARLGCRLRAGTGCPRARPRLQAPAAHQSANR